MKLVFIYGQAASGLSSLFDVSGLYRHKGLTGSESDFFNTGWALAERGHEVTILCNAAERLERTTRLGGASVIPYQSSSPALPQNADAYLAWNDPGPLRYAPSSALRIFKQELNDFSYCKKGFEENIDVFAFLSSVQRDHLLRVETRIPLARTIVAYNSTNLEFFDTTLPRHPRRIIYCSSPDRGLHHLIQLWPSLKNKISDLELHVFYEFDRWYERAHVIDNPIGRRARYIKECTRRLGRRGEEGLFFHGNVSNVSMAQQLSTAGILAYTCDPISFTEGFSISTLDACAAGCIPLLSDADALPSLYGEVAIIIPGKPGKNPQAWIEAIEQWTATADDPVIEKKRKELQQFAKRYSRSCMGERWERFLINVLENRSKALPSFPEATEVRSSLPSSFPEATEARSSLPRAAEATPPTDPPKILSSQDRDVILISEMKSATPDRRSLDIHLWTGPAWETWSPDSLKTGIGGSETAAIHMARNLAGRGHRVTVHATTEGTWDGVTYRHHGDTLKLTQPIRCDVLIVSRQPFILNENKFRSKSTFLWVHDVNVGTPPNINETLMRVDKILVLSRWHRDYFASCYPLLPKEKIVVTRNGIDTSLFEKAARKKGNRLIYSSSPDRGAERLLGLFPRIREQVPDTELHLYYGFETWEAITNTSRDSTRRTTFDHYKKLITENTQPGYHYHGRVGQEELADAFLASKVHAYPTFFHETSCISAMEAQAAGCIPVTTAIAALPETVQHGILIPPPDDSPQYADVFIEHVVKLLRNESLRLSLATSARHWALSTLDWSHLAREWEETLFLPLLAEKERLGSLSLPLYQGA